MNAHEKTSQRANTHSAWNIPNALTVLRIILVPVFVVCACMGPWNYYLAALIVFCVAAYTDRLDGKIARKRGIVTDFGKIADPFADKALMITAFVVLSIQGQLPWWFTIVVILREVAVTLLRFVLLRRGKVLPASSGGKLKTVLQILLVVVIMASLLVDRYSLQATTGLSFLAVLLMVAAFAVTVITGILYFIDASTENKKAKREKRAMEEKERREQAKGEARRRDDHRVRSQRSGQHAQHKHPEGEEKKPLKKQHRASEERPEARKSRKSASTKPSHAPARKSAAPGAAKEAAAKKTKPAARRPAPAPADMPVSRIPVLGQKETANESRAANAAAASRQTLSDLPRQTLSDLPKQKAKATAKKPAAAGETAAAARTHEQRQQTRRIDMTNLRQSAPETGKALDQRLAGAEPAKPAARREVDTELLPKPDVPKTLPNVPKAPTPTPSVPHVRTAPPELDTTGEWARTREEGDSFWEPQGTGAVRAPKAWLDALREEDSADEHGTADAAATKRHDVVVDEAPAVVVAHEVSDESPSAGEKLEPAPVVDTPAKAKETTEPSVAQTAERTASKDALDAHDSGETTTEARVRRLEEFLASEAVNPGEAEPYVPLVTPSAPAAPIAETAETVEDQQPHVPAAPEAPDTHAQPLDTETRAGQYSEDSDAAPVAAVEIPVNEQADTGSVTIAAAGPVVVPVFVPGPPSAGETEDSESEAMREDTREDACKQAMAPNAGMGTSELYIPPPPSWD